MKILALLYGLSFWPVVWWTFVDAKKRGRSAPMLIALGAALFFPFGVALYLGTRESGW